MLQFLTPKTRGHRGHGRDHMVVGFTTTYAINAFTTNVSSNPAQARCTRCNIMWSSLSV